MNQPPTQQAIPNRNLLEGLETLNEFELSDKTNDLVDLTEEHKDTIREGWNEFYNLKTEGVSEIASENSLGNHEIRYTQIEAEFSKPINILDQTEKPVSRPIYIIEEQKGSGSAFAEYGKKLIPEFKDIGKSLLGALSLITEIFMDTASLLIPKKDKKPAQKAETDPEKARIEAEKKVENARRQNNIKAFYEGLKAQIAAVVSPDAERMQTQEKANINLTAKIGHESYSGVKDVFGRLTAYALSMFEQGQKDHEKKAKKAEKESKIASIAKSSGPDLSLDKVAEGGYLSSTGGQGAG